MYYQKLVDDVKKRLPAAIFKEVDSKKGEPMFNKSHTMNSIGTAICDVLAEKVISGETEIVSGMYVDELIKEMFGVETHCSDKVLQSAVVEEVLKTKDKKFDIFYLSDDDGVDTRFLFICRDDEKEEES